MLPTIVQGQVEEASAMAAELQSAASLTPVDQPANRTRLELAAKHIKVLIALLQTATWVAQLNHDTIVNREAS